MDNSNQTFVELLIRRALTDSGALPFNLNYVSFCHMDDVLNMEVIGSMTMQIYCFNVVDYPDYPARVSNNALYVLAKSIRFVVGSSQQSVRRDALIWANAQPLACVKGEPVLEGESSLAHWNRDKSTSSSNASSRIANDVILFRGAKNDGVSSPEVESK